MSDFQQQPANSWLMIIPGSPALIPGIGYGDQPSADSAQAIRQQLQSFTGTVRADVVGSRDRQWYTAHTGSLQAWGSCRCRMSFGNYLPELVAGYFLEEAGIAVTDSRAQLGMLNTSRLTVVVIDGSAGLHSRAPLSLLPKAPAIDQWCTELLSSPLTCDTTITAAQLHDGGIQEPNLWLELAQLAPRVVQARLFIHDKSLGVGRYGAIWEVE